MLPPHSIAIERKGAAFERSGSIIKSRPCKAPGFTLQLLASLSTLTTPPKSRSISTLISICGIEGRAPPLCITVIPFLKLDPTNKSAERNWLDALASIVITPPGITRLA